MKVSKEIVAALGTALNAELYAISRYMAQSLVCKHSGLSKLAGYYRDTAKGEMEHAERILERLALFGQNPMLYMEKLIVEPDVQVQLEESQKSEQEAVGIYQSAAQTAIDQDDAASLKMFQELLADEEKHLEWTEAQKSLIKMMGLDNYLSAQV